MYWEVTFVLTGTIIVYIIPYMLAKLVKIVNVQIQGYLDGKIERR